jgi:hypothetical protein
MSTWIVIILVIAVVSFIFFLVVWGLVAVNRDEEDIESLDETDQAFISTLRRKSGKS